MKSLLMFKIFSSLHKTFPEVGKEMPDKILSKLVFPEPFSPLITNTELTPIENPKLLKIFLSSLKRQRLSALSIFELKIVIKNVETKSLPKV